MDVLRQVMLVLSDTQSCSHCSKVINDAGICQDLVVFNDPVEALTYLRKRFHFRNNPPQGMELPDLILLGDEMELMSGYDFMVSYNAFFSMTQYKIPVFLLADPAAPKNPYINKVYSVFQGYLPLAISADDAITMRDKTTPPTPVVRKRRFQLW